MILTSAVKEDNLSMLAKRWILYVTAITAAEDELTNAYFYGEKLRVSLRGQLKNGISILMSLCHLKNREGFENQLQSRTEDG
jgi:hypothetical protein